MENIQKKLKAHTQKWFYKMEQEDTQKYLKFLRNLRSDTFNVKSEVDSDSDDDFIASSSEHSYLHSDEEPLNNKLLTGAEMLSKQTADKMAAPQITLRQQIVSQGQAQRVMDQMHSVISLW